MTGARAAWRDTVLFLSGLALTYHEALAHRGPDRWGMIFLFAGMMGLPLALRGDERAVQGPPEPPGPPASSGPPRPTGGASTW